jgi:tetratricopeptide (TPR) repeat protein
MPEAGGVYELLLELGLTTRGMDAELAARLLESGEAAPTPAQEDRARLILDRLRRLSFVKPRPEDGRLFLHDEVYDIMYRHYWRGRPSGRIYTTIAKYYEDRIKSIQARIAGLYQREMQDKEARPRDELAARRIELQQALVEDLHYKLRKDLRTGFQAYVVRQNDLITVNDENLNLQLWTELMITVGEAARAATEAGNTARQAEITELLRTHIHPDSAIRHVKLRVVQDCQDDALQIAAQLRNHAADLIQPGGSIVEAELDSWEGLALTYSGNLERASQLLTPDLIERLENFTVKQEDLGWWSAVLARAYNNLGYLYRVQGEPIAAADVYQKAITLLRYLKMETEQANVLNNLAYVLALQGKMQEAGLKGQDALELRMGLGLSIPVVLSLTTLAQNRVLAGEYLEAEKLANTAIRFSKELQFPRGEGLARLNLIAVYRFLSEPENERSLELRQKLLEEARKQGELALRIFQDTAPEAERRARAIYELGITWREIYRVRISQKLNGNDAVLMAARYLQEAANEYQNRQLWFNYLDARLGLAWTHYYSKSEKLDDLLAEIVNEIDAVFPNYRITPHFMPSGGANAIVGIYSQLARLYVLHGVYELDRFEKAVEPEDRAEHLRRAAECFTLTFEYDSLIPGATQGHRRAVNTIYGRLKKLNTREIKALFEGVQRTPGKLMPAGGDPAGLNFYQSMEELLTPYAILRRLPD